jgi:hypothetical protein
LGLNICAQGYGATWQQAFDDCAARNMKLAVLDSQSTQYILTETQKLFPGTGLIWVDGQNSPSCKIVAGDGSAYLPQDVDCNNQFSSFCQDTVTSSETELLS